MTLNFEKRLWKKGCRFVIGIDEAGRGSLAGPVVAAAVSLIQNTKHKIPYAFFDVRDSKKLTPLQREKLYQKLANNPVILWAEGRAGQRVIERINIRQATKLAMTRALNNLFKKLRRLQALKFSSVRDLDNLKTFMVAIDGDMKLDNYIMDIKQKPVLKGDSKIFSCASASIIAKVRRDRYLEKLHKKYPEYGFYAHKGYGTKLHFDIIKKRGPCVLHRLSFL